MDSWAAAKRKDKKSEKGRVPFGTCFVVTVTLFFSCFLAYLSVSLL